jgi:hypothetical protein
MGTIPTVNVIELLGGVVNSIYSFPDTHEGSTNAENLFWKLGEENGMLLRELNDYLNDGIFEEGSYELLITHSV